MLTRALAPPWRYLFGGCLVAVAFASVALGAQNVSIGLNFTGVTLDQGKILNSNSGYVPPDNAGAVGPGNIVQLINGAYAVYNKTTGSQQQLISARQFWSNAGVDPGTSIVNLGSFNQRILYDPTVGRWIAAGLTGNSTDNKVLVAHSETSNPLGPWKAMSFLGNDGGTGKFADYTTLGVDANGVYISTTNFTSNVGGLDSYAVFSLPKADLLAANPTLTNMTRFDGLTGDLGATMQPVINFGPARPNVPILATSPANIDTAIYRSDLTGTAAAGAQLSSEPEFITVSQYSHPPKAAQPDGTRNISTIDDRFSSNVYQLGDTLYAVHAIKVGANSGVHWMKIDETSNAVIQEGILSDPAFDYFQPSIAANADGDIVISFNRSGFGAGGNLSVFAAVGDTLNDVTTFGAPFLLKASLVNNYHNTNNRWGDWSTTVVDPSNPNAFWTFQEFATANNSWGTQITQIFVPEPGSVVLASVGGAALLFVAYRRRRRLRAS